MGMDFPKLYPRLPELLKAINEPTWSGPGTVKGDLKEAVEAAKDPKQSITNVTFQFATKLKVEEALVLSWAATNEARMCALDWLSLTTTIEVLKTSMASLDAEIEVQRKHRPMELDAQERSLIESIDTAKLYANVDELKCEHAANTVKDYFNTAERQRSEDAISTVAHVSMRRDPVPGATAPWANATDPAFDKFEAGKAMYVQAAAAQVWQQRRAFDISERGLGEQSEELSKSGAAAASTINGLTAQLGAVDAQRRAAAEKVAALQVQRESTRARLVSTEIDWNTRAAGLLNRYVASVRKVKVYANALVACIENLHPEAFPTSFFQSLNNVAESNTFNVGSRLDEMAVYLGDIEAMLRAEQLSSAIGRIDIILADTPLGGEVNFDIKGSDYSWADRAHLQGMSCALLGGDEKLLLTAEVLVPAKSAEHSIKPIGGGPSQLHSIDQVEIGTVRLGVIARRGTRSAEEVQGAAQCWNGSPFGQWTLTNRALAGGKTGVVDIHLTLHVSYQKPTLAI